MRTLILFLFISSFTFLQAQKIEVVESNINTIKTSEPKLDREDEYENATVPFSIVEQIPLFISCKNVEKTNQRECFQEEMKKHMEKHLKYPKKAKENNIQSKIFTTFDIDENGKVTNIQVRSKNTTEYKILFEEEAKRIINELPNFIPATQRGKIVKVTYGIPINFKL